MEKLSFYLKLLVNYLLISVIASIIIRMSTLSKMILHKFELIAPDSSVLENSNTLIIAGIVSVLILMYLFVLIRKFRKAIYETGTNSFFSEKNERIFRSVGSGIIYYTGIMFVIKLVEHSFDKVVANEALHHNTLAYNSGVIIGQIIRECVPLLVIALFLLIIAQLIEDGYSLKLENDLTV